MTELDKYFETYWDSYDGETELDGLTPFGMQGNQPLNIKSFDKDQLNWALDFAKSCGTPIKSFNNRHTSYGLKHLAERRARRLSAHDEKRVDYITNGALILAMIDAGFDFKRDGDSPNVFFNVSEKELKRLYKYYNNMA